MKKYKCGFTLAEILITLGIIGIISAMTMSIIVGNVKKHVAKNQFKKAYSTISNAFNLSIQEYGENLDCYYVNNREINSDCRTFFINYFYKKLNVAKYCVNNAYQNGCLPDYSSSDFPSSSGCSLFYANNIKTQLPVVLLKNGTIIFVYSRQGYTSPVIAVDINGFKGPNKGGIDVFSFKIQKIGNQIPTINVKNSINFCMPVSDEKFFNSIMDVWK